MGNGLFVLGRYEEAIRYFDRALRTARSHPDLGTSRHGHHGQGPRPDRAGGVTERPRSSSTTLSTWPAAASVSGNESELLLVLADLQSRQGRHDEALTLTRQAAEIASAGGFLRNEAEAWGETVRASRRSRRLFGRPSRPAAKALQATLRLGDAYALPERFSALAGLRRALGQPRGGQRPLQSRRQTSSTECWSARTASEPGQVCSQLAAPSTWTIFA